MSPPSPPSPISSACVTGSPSSSPCTPRPGPEQEATQGGPSPYTWHRSPRRCQQPRDLAQLCRGHRRRRRDRTPPWRHLLHRHMNLSVIDKDDGLDHALIATLSTLTPRSRSTAGLSIIVRGRPQPGFTTPPDTELYPRHGNRFLPLTENVIMDAPFAERCALLAAYFPARPTPCTHALRPVADR